MHKPKLWGGRFEKDADSTTEDFLSSISVDQRLYRQDIAGSIAHATMLGEQGVISPEDASRIVSGLEGILADIESGNLTFDAALGAALEDIHTHIESLLTARIGEAGKRLHTGRSRNDQVALDARLYVKEIAAEARSLLAALCELLLRLSSAHLHTVMPGYTHLQKAQPTTLAHHLMAYFQMFARDMDRFGDVHRRADAMPLGSGALAGTTFPLDRERVAKLLGFSGITQNSLDAVSDRDFVLDYLSAASLTMMHLSRFCEELILWSSDEFRFAEMADAFSTGSSIMPQKKNPDVAELIRGKTGRVYGDLFALLTTMKGLPLAYNKDMQEDKEALFDARDTLAQALPLFTRMLSATRFRTEVLSRAAAAGFTNATDAADYLTKRGMPFRQAHEVIGKLVLHCLREGQALLDLSLEELRAFSPLFDQDVFQAIAIETCVEMRCLPGGPSPSAVQASIDAGRALLRRSAI